MRAIRVLVGLTVLSAVPAAAQQTPVQPDGRAVFEMVCAMCHSVTPPAKLAPPMSHAAAYYLRRHGAPDSAAAAIVAYLKAPSAESSVLPSHAIERFGLMPTQSHLSEAQLKAVAQYVLTVADTAHVRPGMQHH